MLRAEALKVALVVVRGIEDGREQLVPVVDEEQISAGDDADVRVKFVRSRLIVVGLELCFIIVVSSQKLVKR